MDTKETLFCASSEPATLATSGLFSVGMVPNIRAIWSNMGPERPAHTIFVKTFVEAPGCERVNVPSAKF